MVMLHKWPRIPTDKRSCSDFPVMSSESTAIGESAPLVAGYLGKSQERLHLEKNCPVCAAKGQTQALRAFHISFQESIILCGNPQCIFPLGSKPLADILLHGTSEKPHIANSYARKRTLSSSGETQAEPSSKSPKAAEEIDPAQNTSGTRVVCKPCSVVLTYSKVCESKLQTEGQNVHYVDTRSPPKELDFSCPDPCSPGKDTKQPSPAKNKPCEVTSEGVQEGSSEELVPAPPFLFWKNQHSLCWLDSLMVVLVHSSAVRENLNTLQSDSSPLRRLCTEYDKAQALLQEAQRTSSEGEVGKIPSGVLLQAESLLNEIRMSVFNLLQPKLRCKLGSQESPVFALPLLLQLDQVTEELFKSSFHWEFACFACGHSSRSRRENTLTTFTGIIPEWNPLNAAHASPCPRCDHKHQMRKMVLERVPPVFMLHFVEGLPHNDMNAYAFDFQEMQYAVCAVIQYDQLVKHFVTWLHNEDGTWLECDDLKYPLCIHHKHLEVPSKEIHIVFWDACRKSTVTGSGLHLKEECVKHVPPEEGTAAEADALDTSLPLLEVDSSLSDIVAQEESDDLSAHAGLNATLTNSDMRDAFEGLSHNDIVTLTLVEVKVDAEGRPLDSHRVPDSTDCSDQTAAPEENRPGGEDFGLLNNSSGSPPPRVNQSSETPASLLCPAELCGPQTRSSEKAPVSVQSSQQTPREKRVTVDSKNREEFGTAAKVPPASDVRTALSPDTTSPPAATTTALPATAAASAVNGGKSGGSGDKWSVHFLNRHPVLRSSSTHFKAVPVAPSRPSQPFPTREQQSPRPLLALGDDGNFPGKSAEMFGGFRSKGVATSKGSLPSRETGLKMQDVSEEALLKPPCPPSPCLPLSKANVISSPSSDSAGFPVNATKPDPRKAVSTTSALKGHDKTDKLRYKLLKKLKAKKQKLASLNSLLKLNGFGDTSVLPESHKSTVHLDAKKILQRLESTDTESMYTVSSASSLCASPSYDEFFADLLSPSTTDSSVSPDSTDCLERLANGKQVRGLLDGSTTKQNCYQGSIPLQTQGPNLAVSESPFAVTQNGLCSTGEDIFEELMSNSTLQSCEAESTDLSTFDLFF
uniref:Ubiquitin specific peptidase like 1 n=1 Tax=Lepisosteus oculatus TaxID=7918 RepID=W5LVR4_LEPOC